MKKISAFTAIIIAISLFGNVTAFAGAETAAWSENDPSVTIYEPGTIHEEFYQVEYNNVSAETAPGGGNVRLLMVNGGFVPFPEIVVEDDRTLVPVRIISETLGADVDWDAGKQTVTITDGGSVIELTVGGGSEAKLIGSKTYVPLRFVAERLNAQVQYIPDFLFGEATSIPFYSQREKVSAVVVERGGTAVFTPEEGLEAVKGASAATHEYVSAYLKETGRAFGDAEYISDYDPASVVYTGESMGRYYLYKLTGFEEYIILFNKYTGNIYSAKPGLPFVHISEGFINIGWLYQ